MRDAFLQRRAILIYDGSPPASKYDDEDDDDKPQAPPKPGAALDGGDSRSVTSGYIRSRIHCPT